VLVPAYCSNTKSSCDNKARQTIRAPHCNRQGDPRCSAKTPVDSGPLALDWLCRSRYCNEHSIIPICNVHRLLGIIRIWWSSHDWMACINSEVFTLVHLLVVSRWIQHCLSSCPCLTFLLGMVGAGIFLLGGFSFGLIICLSHFSAVGHDVCYSVRQKNMIYLSFCFLRLVTVHFSTRRK
jgi:hypothetical protein